MHRLTDEQLMDRLQQGRTEALDELYRRYSRRLYAFCCNFLRPHSPQDPEDIVQDVFLRLIKSAHTFDPQRASFRTWLYRIARNRCIDVSRRAAILRFVPLGRGAEGDEEAPPAGADIAGDGLPAAGLIDHDGDVASAVMRASVVEAVRGCIDELRNRDERLAFLLYYLGDKVYREIGEVLGRSTSMARKRVKAAQEKVRRCLERTGVEGGL